MKKSNFFIANWSRELQEVYAEKVHGYISGEIGLHKRSTGEWIPTHIPTGRQAVSSWGYNTRKEALEAATINLAMPSTQEALKNVTRTEQHRQFLCAVHNLQLLQPKAS